MVLLVASFIVYNLTAISGDPLLELRGSHRSRHSVPIAYLTDILDLDVPTPNSLLLLARGQLAV